MPSYRCELEGLCGAKMKVTVWNDRFILQCDRCGFQEKHSGQITIPYIKEVRLRCQECPLREVPQEV